MLFVICFHIILYAYYDSRDIHILDKVLNMLFAKYKQDHFGALNSAFLDMLVMHGKGNDLSMMVWFKEFRQDQIDSGMIAIPACLHNKQDVKRL